MAYTQRGNESHSSVSGGCYGHQTVGCSQLVEAHNSKLTCASGTKFGIEPALQDRISFYYLSGVTRKNRTNTTIAGQSAKEIDRQPILKKFKTQFQHMWKLISVCMYDCQKMLSRGVLKLQTPVFYRAIVAISNHFSNKEGVAAEINEGSRFWKKVELVGAIGPLFKPGFSPLHSCTGVGNSHTAERSPHGSFCIINQAPRTQRRIDKRCVQTQRRCNCNQVLSTCKGHSFGKRITKELMFCFAGSNAFA